MEVGKLTRLGTGDAVVIPRAYLRQLGWLTGQHVAILITGRTVQITGLEDHVITTRNQNDRRGAVGLDAITRRARFQKD